MKNHTLTLTKRELLQVSFNNLLHKKNTSEYFDTRLNWSFTFKLYRLLLKKKTATIIDLVLAGSITKFMLIIETPIRR
jgi:hypothetical protein